MSAREMCNSEARMVPWYAAHVVANSATCAFLLGAALAGLIWGRRQWSDALTREMRREEERVIREAKEVFIEYQPNVSEAEQNVLIWELMQRIDRATELLEGEG